MQTQSAKPAAVHADSVLRTVGLWILGLTCLVLPVASQTFIDEIRIRILDPSGGVVRPLEQAVLQVQVYGRLRSKDGRETQGLLPVDGAFMAFGEKNTGWLSKAYQCPDFRQADYVRERRGNWQDILGAVQDFALKNCFLYTAPPQPGNYLVQASINGVAGDIRIPVSASAPSTRKPESYNFPPEPPSSDPYFPLAEHYAPFIAQETWFSPMADAIARFDYDGDFSGDNNWDNLGSGSTQAYVYYAVVETQTHWFLHYNFFHPRDYSDVCMAGSCHENDNEGMILAVRKDGSKFGKPEVMQTLAHDVLFTYTADDRIENGAHEVKGPLILHEGSHPMVFIEAGGHGVLGISDRTYSLFEHQVMEWLPGYTGITYVYKGVAERPYHAGATNVGYALLPIYEHWWLRSGAEHRSERTFSDFFTYLPLGNRPSLAEPMIAGAFLGIKEASNKAKPFWGWHDDRTLKAGILARGQWGLDPAYAFSRNLRFPLELPISLDYTFNPFLGIGTRPGLQPAATTAVKGTFPTDPSGAESPQSDSTASPAPTPGTPSLGGFGSAVGSGGWGASNSSQQTTPPRGWGQPSETKPSTEEEGPRGWGPNPPSSNRPPNKTKPANQTPKGWGTPTRPND